jgi:hypothetical protein
MLHAPTPQPWLPGFRRQRYSTTGQPEDHVSPAGNRGRCGASHTATSGRPALRCVHAIDRLTAPRAAFASIPVTTITIVPRAPITVKVTALMFPPFVTPFAFPPLPAPVAAVGGSDPCARYPPIAEATSHVVSRLPDVARRRACSDSVGSDRV